MLSDLILSHLIHLIGLIVFYKLLTGATNDDRTRHRDQDGDSYTYRR